MRLVALDMASDSRQVVCFGDHLHAVLAVEKQPQAAAHQRMVVGQQHADIRIGRRRIRILGAASQVKM